MAHPIFGLVGAFVLFPIRSTESGKQLEQLLQQITTASRGHRLFEAHADQGLLVAKQQVTTLRLGHLLLIVLAKLFHFMVLFLAMA